MSQKMNGTTSDPDQGDDEDALTKIQRHKNCIPKKRKKWGGKKRMSDFKKKSEKDSKWHVCPRNYEEMWGKTISFLSDFAQSNLFCVAKRNQKGGTKRMPDFSVSIYTHMYICHRLLEYRCTRLQAVAETQSRELPRKKTCRTYPVFPDDSWFFQLIRVVTTSALHKPQERLPSRAPEEFGRMIF